MSGVDVATFVLARLAEDEQVARAFVNELGEAARWECDEIGGVIRSRGVPFAHFQTHLDAAHIARHDPARVLADVAAKRAIVELHRSAAQAMSYDSLAQKHGDRYCMTCSDDDMSYWNDREPPEWPCPTLRLLAQPYADHEDYDPAWTVTP